MVLVESKETDTESFLQYFWTWAEHIGIALSKVANAAKKQGIDNPYCSEIALYDFDDFDTSSDELKQIEDTDIFVSTTRHYYPTEPCLRLADGVVGAMQDGDFDAEDLQAGFDAYLDDEFYCINAVLEQEQILPLFLKLSATLPNIKVCWVVVTDAWEDTDVNQFWANTALNNMVSIKPFLEYTKKNILKNGLVSFTVFSDEGATNLSITDHKEIRLVTHSEQVQQTMVQTLLASNIQQSNELNSISGGFHHWHYQQADSLNRTDFIQFLQAEGFTFWQEITAEDED